MVKDILTHIQTELNLLNTYFDKTAVNCIKDDEGRVLFGEGNESMYGGISDIPGKAYYIRFNGSFSFNDVSTRKKSCSESVKVTVPLRLVAFTIDDPEPIGPVRWEEKLRNDLLTMNFSSYDGFEQNITIELLKSNHQFRQVYNEELGKDYDSGESAVIIALDFNLVFNYSAVKAREECMNNCYPFENE